MKRLIVSTIISLLLTASVAVGAESMNTNRHFMFIGEPNAAAWQYMIENPEDRKKQVANAFKALGGEVISYYFGLGDGKNYITVTIPNDNELIQSIYLMRLPSGMLKSYKIIELMPSEEMSKALKRTKMLIDSDKTIKK